MNDHVVSPSAIIKLRAMYLLTQENPAPALALSDSELLNEVSSMLLHLWMESKTKIIANEHY